MLEHITDWLLGRRPAAREIAQPEARLNEVAKTTPCVYCGSLPTTDCGQAPDGTTGYLCYTGNCDGPSGDPAERLNALDWIACNSARSAAQLEKFRDRLSKPRRDADALLAEKWKPYLRLINELAWLYGFSQSWDRLLERVLREALYHEHKRRDALGLEDVRAKYGSTVKTKASGRPDA